MTRKQLLTCHQKKSKHTVEDDSDTEATAHLPPEEVERIRDNKEDLVVAAVKHVDMARKQRYLFIAKKGEARLHAQE